MARLPETGHERAAFEWADKITYFCDNVAFDFSFEAPRERTMILGSGHGTGEETAVTYQIQADGQVVVNPWPFSVPLLSGIMMGYEAAGYPDLLEPVMVPFEIKKA